MRRRTGVISAILCSLVILTGCARQAPVASPVAAPPTPAPVPVSTTPCVLPPLVVPTPPARSLEYLELDPITNLHMTGTAQQIDVAAYHLVVTGKVDRPLSLTYDDLRCLPRKQVRALLECPGFFQDTATWAGAPLDAVLALAGL